MTASGPAELWSAAFLERLQDAAVAAPLKQASLASRLAEWTAHLTAVVVRTCETIGWKAAAKGFPLQLLPQLGQEYLGIDVMAFPAPERSDESSQRWRLPVAVFELENSRQDDRVAYSLWKVLCVRVMLRVVFAYRNDWEEARQLVRRLAEEVVPCISVEERASLVGETLLVIGSRGEGETFPWGYFKLWKLDKNTGRFEKT